jgi:chorismate mutase / prephenate dehydratase
VTNPRPAPPPPRPLGELRAAIDSIDVEILRLLCDRARIAAEVGEYKRSAAPGLPFHVPSREREVLARLEQLNPGPFPTGAIRAVFQEIMSACLSLERPLRVAFLGPEGTSAHQAVKHQFGASAHPIPQRTIQAVFRAVEAGHADYGVVPVENETRGVVDSTLDSFLESTLRVVSEILLPFELALLVHGDAELSTLARVYAPPDSFPLAEAWLGAHVPGAAHVAAASAAEAARLAREDPDGAALAPDVIARLFDLRVAAEGIQVGGEATRFWVLGQKPAQRTGRDRTSLVVSVRDSPGVLLRVLEPLARHNVNMTRIESRPAPRRAWEYVFFLDLEGHETDEPIAAAIREVEQAKAEVKLLGSYPRGEAAAPGTPPPGPGPLPAAKQ